MWQTVELRELRLLRTLAEELHFGRTAERLQLTPSRVSQVLRALEHKLGVRSEHSGVLIGWFVGLVTPIVSGCLHRFDA